MSHRGSFLSNHKPNGNANANNDRTFSMSFDERPLARESLRRDIEAEEEEDDDEGAITDSDDSEDAGARGPPLFTLSASVPSQTTPFSLSAAFRRPSLGGLGARASLAPSLYTVTSHHARLPKDEQERIVQEERSLLRDNNLIPPKHPREDGVDDRRESLLHTHNPFAIRARESISRRSQPVGTATETSPLLGDASKPYGGQDDPQTIKDKWNEAIQAGQIQTTWQRETKTVMTYTLPLMVTFLLQYSLTVASIFTVGHIGTTELGAVSLASMTASITGYAVYQGLATSLDTLCAQAYGSGRKKLVGLQMQRMTYFLWAITIPIAFIWFFADKILLALVPEREVAELGGLYLKVVLIGAPGFAAFEAGKRFVQAQGLFSASLYVLIILAPLNAFMNWLFVWKLGWGFVGAPIAVAITDNLLPLGLWFYIYFFCPKGLHCWNGFTKQAWRNWGPMVKLALPGVIMVEAEVLAFEILTFASSYFGVRALAAQSVLATLTNITWQIPFPLSIAVSTRVANLIGATLEDAARLTVRVGFVASVVIGLLNVTLLSSLRNYIPYLFTSDEEVIALVARVLPVCAAFQLFDALAAMANGTLRGLGRQDFGGYVQLFCYYVVAMPVSMGTAFGLGWGLTGLWCGVALALLLVFSIEYVFLQKMDWGRSVEEAKARNLDAEV